jgi:hypothetical protein
VAQAQQVLAAASSSAPPPGSALPPPGINDPGEKPTAVPLPDTGLKPSLAPAARQQDANGTTADVTAHTEPDGDRVEEYRRNGTVYMVRITPRHGVTQTYMYNSPDGSLMHDSKLGPVSPVYYDLYKWGKPRKPAGSAAASAPRPPPASSSRR